MNRIDPRGLEDCSPDEEDCRDPGDDPWLPYDPGGNGPSQRGGGGQNRLANDAAFLTNQRAVTAAIMNTQARIANAVAAALTALANPNCAGLFNLNPNAPAPADLLVQMYTGTDPQVFFGIQFLPTPQGNSWVNATTSYTPWSMQNGQPVNNPGNLLGQVVVNFNFNPGAPFNNSGATANAVTVLHELGHVYEFLYGLGSTYLVNDSSEAQGPNAGAASNYNTQLVQTNCFPGGVHCGSFF